MPKKRYFPKHEHRESVGTTFLNRAEAIVARAENLPRCKSAEGMRKEIVWLLARGMQEVSDAQRRHSAASGKAEYAKRAAVALLGALRAVDEMRANDERQRLDDEIPF